MKVLNNFDILIPCVKRSQIFNKGTPRKFVSKRAKSGPKVHIF